MRLNHMIDHTLLRPDAKPEDVSKYCYDAIKHGFASVVVNSVNLPQVVKELAATTIKPVAVIGFPLGAMLPHAKSIEASLCAKLGAKEIDMVINVGALKAGHHQIVFDDIKAVVDSSKPALVKVIIETSYLTDAEKIIACHLSEKAGAHFVKTSTGFSSQGATLEDVKLMRGNLGPKVKVKASGGIRTKEDAIAFIEAGADRLGIGDGTLVV